MRDILFRAKTVDNNEWVYGYYANCHHDSLENNTTGHFIIEYPDKYHEIYTDTISQYTGLCDKNGTKIFEGDIVENISGERDYIGVVRYCKAHFAIEWGRLKDVLRNDLHFWASERKLEVIGNVYENKELLEG